MVRSGVAGKEVQTSAARVKSKGEKKRPGRPVAKTTIANAKIPFASLIFLAALLILLASVRLRLRNIPLERDEGEYAYAGQLILQGIAPYHLAYNMKLPGTYAAYALLMAIFGKSPAGIHAGMIFVNGATVVLMFFLARRLFDDTAGFAAACSYALFSNSHSVFGFAGHATHFVVLSAVGAIVLLLEAIEKRRPWLYLLSGCFFGLAFVCKQQGIVFVLFGFFYLTAKEWRDWLNRTGIGRLACFAAGVAAPFALTCLILFLAGQLERMWFWTFVYARRYASLGVAQGWEALSANFPDVIAPCLILWILAGIGLLAHAWDSRIRKHLLFTAGWLVFSCCGVSIGFFFRPHYFILLLPVLSLLVGIALTSTVQNLLRISPLLAAIPWIAFLVALVVPVVNQSDILFELDPAAACRKMYSSNPFPEAEVVSRYLKQNTKPNARIAVLGSEPEIYFYSGRHSATGYIYVYPLFEPQQFASQMQREMAKEIEDSNPDYVVLVKNKLSWLVQPGADHYFFDWFTKYLALKYQIVGAADMDTPETQYVWGDEARLHQQEKQGMEIFRRISMN